MNRRWLAGAALVLSLLPRGAAAQEKRPLPDYDGRPREQPSKAWWVPRVAMFPFWALHRYAIRAPIRAVVLVFDRDAALGHPTRDRFDVHPVIVLDNGLRPRFGLYVLGRRTHGGYRVYADTFGPTSYLLGAAAFGETFERRVHLEAYSEVMRRPDTIFHGLGPESSRGARKRVALDRGETGLRLAVTPSSWFRLDASLVTRGHRFRTENVERDYVAFAQRVAITLDARPLERAGITLDKPEYRRKNGAYLTLDGELAESPSPSRSWTAYGGTLTGAFDVTGTERVIELATTARFVDPLSGGAPPYVEHVSLGGDRYLRGHLAGRLFGRSALVASAEYRWPVWVFLDGFVRVDAGNVFGAHLQGLDPGLFRLSATTGMRNVGRTGYVFEWMAGIGTEPISEGANVSSFRLLFSASRPR